MWKQRLVEQTLTTIKQVFESEYIEESDIDNIISLIHVLSELTDSLLKKQKLQQVKDLLVKTRDLQAVATEIKYYLFF